ncbi:RidA family protein [Streptomyces sp. A1-5]|uniref:RidA family protein n=1 Tax=Streptomyces sp. A1-5 TaxID=2738410 RepID=UPI003FA7DF51
MQLIEPAGQPTGLSFCSGYALEPGARLVFLSLITPERHGKVPVASSEQMHACLDNLDDTLALVGGQAEPVKVNYFATDSREIAVAGRAWQERYGRQLAAAWLEGPASPVHEARVTMDLWATAPPARTPQGLRRVWDNGPVPVATVVDSAATLHMLTAAPTATAEGSGPVRGMADCLEHLDQQLAAMSASASALAKLVVYLRDVRTWPPFRDMIIARYGPHCPALSPVMVAKTARPEHWVEVAAWAATPHTLEPPKDSGMGTADLRERILASAGTGSIPIYIGATAHEMYTGYVPPATIEEHTHIAMRNQLAILRAAGTSLDHVFKSTWYLTDLRERAGVEAVAHEYFGRDLPTPSFVEISRLAPVGARLETDLWATIPSTARIGCPLTSNRPRRHNRQPGEPSRSEH